MPPQSTTIPAPTIVAINDNDPQDINDNDDNVVIVKPMSPTSTATTCIETPTKLSLGTASSQQQQQEEQLCPKTPLHVTFSDKPDDIYFTDTVYEMSTQEIENTWYSQYDWIQMDKALQEVIQYMDNNNNNNTDNDTMTKLPLDIRGLESKTKKGYKALQERKLQAWDAVLDEQYRQQQQQYGSIQSPERIALLYQMTIADECQQDAYLMAQQDANF